MGEKNHKKNKVYYSMGEVTEMFDVNPSLIRYWESKFDIIKPHKNKKGNRLFTPADVDNLKLIYHLVKEKGMTLQGAQKRIKDNKEGLRRDMEVIESLNTIRSILMEIREELKTGSGDILIEEYETGEESHLSKSSKQQQKEEVALGRKDDIYEAEDNETPFEIDIEAMERTLAFEKDDPVYEEEEEILIRDEDAEIPQNKNDNIFKENIVADTVQMFLETEPKTIEPDYIAELSEELAEEASTAAEVMEAIAALGEDEDEPAKPHVYDQTLF